MVGESGSGAGGFYHHNVGDKGAVYLYVKMLYHLVRQRFLQFANRGSEMFWRTHTGNPTAEFQRQPIAGDVTHDKPGFRKQTQPLARCVITHV